MADIERSIEYVVSAVDNATKTFRGISLGAAAMGATITGALGFAVKSAAEAQVQISKMDAILKTVKGSSAEAREKIMTAADATLKLGFDNEEAAVSIAKLYQRTGDVNQAISLNNLAMDLSRAKHLDLGTAANLVGLVMSGNGRILKQYG